MSKIILGIDPGIGGAVAVLGTPRALAEVFDMPTAKIKVGKKLRSRLVESELVSKIAAALGNPCLEGDEVIAYVEEVHAMPKQGVASTFQFGVSYGQVLGILAAMNIPVRLVTPQAWQKAMRVPKGKEGARVQAAREFPEAKFFTRSKDHGRADAVLIALYGASK